MKAVLFIVLLHSLTSAQNDKGLCGVRMVGGKLEKFGNCKDNSWLTQRLEVLSEFKTMSNGLSYRLFKGLKTYNEAKDECKKFGARLASAGMRDPKVKIDLKNLAIAARENAWFGLNDIETEGRFVWEDGVVLTDLSTLDWERSQPDNYGGREDCVHFWKGAYEINDGPCDTYGSFICEK